LGIVGVAVASALPGAGTEMLLGGLLTVVALRALWKRDER
jgi:hypothetical protein